MMLASLATCERHSTTMPCSGLSATLLTGFSQNAFVSLSEVLP